MARKRAVPDDANVQLSVRISVDLHKRTKLHCISEGLGLGQFIVEALSEYLTEQQAQPEEP